MPLSLRAQRVGELRRGVSIGERASHDLLFRIVYGIPIDVQIGLARYMTARFLPIYLAHHPGILWPHKVLTDIDEYFSENGQFLPEAPEDGSGGVARFRFCLYGLLRAVSYALENNSAKVTAACCTTLIWAVNARADNVWYADDPEAASAFEADDWEAYRERTSRFNAASQAVTRREWLIVCDWLDEHEVGTYPDSEHPKCEEVLAWWQDRECLL